MEEDSFDDGPIVSADNRTNKLPEVAEVFLGEAEGSSMPSRRAIGE